MKRYELRRRRWSSSHDSGSQGYYWSIRGQLAVCCMTMKSNSGKEWRVFIMKMTLKWVGLMKLYCNFTIVRERKHEGRAKLKFMVFGKEVLLLQDLQYVKGILQSAVDCISLCYWVLGGHDIVIYIQALHKMWWELNQKIKLYSVHKWSTRVAESRQL